MTKSDLQRRLKIGPTRTNKLGDAVMTVTEFKHYTTILGGTIKIVQKIYGPMKF